ncbi:divalent cation tolerance protein CutA [bacterium]|nr:divalent cation tolerance protein CutA [bacterium]MBT3580829.1 divalent cation tolerance protein CutA [bacterium]MBT4552394.1 divalent cation tolerance protein CutA [bacterium]MBT5988995.1 divalent cation tolerance protein CutA [bacterium]MBT7088467.1 divalent cation tolerance protein CutA [bacterium]
MKRPLKSCAAPSLQLTYEIPEILAMPVQNGYKPYLQWLESNVE